MTPQTALYLVLKDIANSTYEGQKGVAAIDEVCRPYKLSSADVAWVSNHLLEKGFITNVSTGLVAITAEGRQTLATA